MIKFAFVPNDPPEQAHRMQRFLIAVASSVLVWLLMYVFAIHGHLQPIALAYVGGGMLFLFALFYALFRSGLNLKARDPSLTSAQMLSSIATIGVAMFFASNESRGVFSILFVMSFFFGIFRLGIREMIVIVIITFVFYLLLIGMLLRFRPDAIDVPLELLRCTITTTVLVWFAIMAGYLGRLRKQLVDSNTNLEYALQTIQEMTTTDPLTNICSRHFLLDMLEREKVRSARTGKPFSVCIADIDRFKTVNDGLGHYAGDKLLQNIAAIAGHSLRAGDFLGRYGGDEFMLLLTNTKSEAAAIPAERLRRQVQDTTFSDLGSGVRVTVSIGIAEYRPEEDVAQTVHRADVALQHAKSDGRNRIAFAEEAAAA